MAEEKPPQDPFEMFRRLWGPLGVPLPGMAMPTLDPNEVDRVEILRGANTSVFGYQAMGGAIALFSPQPQSQPSPDP